MNIQGFISSLLPTFGRDRIFEDLRFTSRDVSELIKVYNEAGRLFKGHSPKSPVVQELFAQFKRLVATPGADNAIVHIATHLPEILENVGTAEKMAAKYLNNTVAGQGLTMKQATIVRYCDALFLVTKFARKFLAMTMAYEAAQYPGLTTLAPEDSVPAVELKWLQKSIMDFCYAYNAVLGEPQKVMEEVEALPDLEVAKSNLGILDQTMGPSKTDPRRLNFIGTTYNPIYYFRMAVAEWQHSRWKAAKEELQLLELRLAQMQKLQKGQADAKLERNIAYMERRVKDLNYNISQMEK